MPHTPSPFRARGPLVVLLLAALASSGCHRATAHPIPQRGADTLSLRADVDLLASPDLEGRGTGTPGNDSAAVYIARRFQEMGLQPVITTACGAPPCEPGFLQPFEARSAVAAHAGIGARLPTSNVIGVVRGSDSALRDEYLVVGAHFDHLGRHTFGALDPQAGDAIRPGADDNASGTAAMMELARLFKDRPARRSILFAGFSGEELGLLGSQHFVSNPPVSVSEMAAMINFDMVGRLRDGRLIIYGVATANEFSAWIDSANVHIGLAVRGVGDGFGPSDHASFYARDIPVLHFFTDLHEDYHRATDLPERINIAGLGQVVELAEGVIRRIADADQRPAVVRVAAAPQVRAGGRGAYLGTIPDMSAADIAGVRLTGVRADSPADKAGLQEGDVIVEFGGRAVGDLYQYTDALNAHAPGDTVEIIVLRGGQRVRLTATLSQRGG